MRFLDMSTNSSSSGGGGGGEYDETTIASLSHMVYHRPSGGGDKIFQQKQSEVSNDLAGSALSVTGVGTAAASAGSGGSLGLPHGLSTTLHHHYVSPRNLKELDLIHK